MNKGVPWTEEEKLILERTDLSIRQIQTMLPHRTYAAIAVARTKRRADRENGMITVDRANA